MPDSVEGGKPGAESVLFSRIPRSTRGMKTTTQDVESDGHETS